MDFSYLLELAKNNDQHNKKEAAVNRFSTKLAKTKLVKKAGPNMNAVQKVLSKMEQEKQQEVEESRRKKENLLALRAQDRKANKRVKAMINMTKGSNKSVLEDAKDLMTAKGEEQCDEDDYGYESTRSQQIFSKLANQYASAPEETKPKFVKTSAKANIADIKSRVINSLKKEEEEESMPRKRKRKHKHQSMEEVDDFINDGDAYDGCESLLKKPSLEKKSSSLSTSQKVVNVNVTNYKSNKYNSFKYGHDKGSNAEKEKERERERERSPKPVSKKKNKPKAAPPPMSYEQLLREAQKKQAVPLTNILEEREKEREKKKDKELERPMTAKEKEELEEERRRKLRRMGKLPSEKKEAEKPVERDATKMAPPDARPKKSSDKDNNSRKSEDESKLKQLLEKPKPEPKTYDRSKYFAAPFPQKSREIPTPAPKPQASSISSKFSGIPGSNSKKAPAPFPPQRNMPPKSSKPSMPSRDRRKDYPGPDMRRKTYAPPSPPPRMRIESDDEEEEYDSEMDDFIDDGDTEMDVSSEIKKMFGYDKSRYMDDDDDCDDMEASFSQMQKEERISAKIGLREDLEDIRREEEEKKAKMKRLKQMQKGRR